MKLFFVLITVFAPCLSQKLVCSLPKQPPNNDPQRGNRIYGGYSAGNGQIPWQVFINTYNEISSGALLTEEWIITTASAVVNKTIIEMTLGSIVRGDGLSIVPQQIVVHPEYVNEDGNSDVALIQLPAPINLDDYPTIRPIALARIDYPPGTLVNVSGWGEAGASGTYSPFLKYTILNLVFDDECSSYLNATLISDVFCARPVLSTDSPCHGDTGGPLVVLEDNVYLLLGLYNTEIIGGCGMPSTISGFVRLSKFITWIRDYVPGV